MRIPKIVTYDNSSNKIMKDVDCNYFNRFFYNLDYPRDKDKFIKTVERIVRSSLEYKELINYLKTAIGMNFCSFFHKVSKEMYPGGNKIDIEIHHEPFTLYDIVAIILTNRMLTGKKERIDLLDISEEVMSIHYEGIVGLIPLSNTVHELVHSGKVFIPLQLIDKGFNIFFLRYQKAIYALEGLKDILELKLNTSKTYGNNIKEYCSILEKKYIYTKSDLDIDKLD